MTNLVLHFTNIVFTAVLQSAPAVAGPWVDRQFSYSGCPITHSFTVAISNGSQFFRLRLLDNGVEPTPENVSATRTSSTSIGVATPLSFRCDDSQAGLTEFWRSYNGGASMLIATVSNPSYHDTNLSAGTYRYRARISGGLFADIAPVVALP